METIKKISLVLLIAGFGFSASAQETPKKHVCTTEKCKKKHSKKEAKEKDHVCTDACHSSGKHVYKHGEKGHVCDESCKKAA